MVTAIQSRLKSGSSIYEKLKRRKLPVSIESIENNLADIAGIRVICPFLEDVYYLEKALLAQDDVQLIERKNYIFKYFLTALELPNIPTNSPITSKIQAP